MLSLFGSVVVVGFTVLRRSLPAASSELVPGFLATTIIVAIQISYEFTFMEFTLHDLWAINAGILVAVLAQNRLQTAKAGRSSMARPVVSHAA